MTGGTGSVGGTGDPSRPPAIEPPVAEDERDPAVQPERTRLAWRRTTLAGGVVAALAWRHALHVGEEGSRFLVAAFATLTWLALVAVTERRIRRLAQSRTPALSAPLALGTVAGVLTLTACAAVLITYR